MDAPFDLDTVDRLLSTTRAVRKRLDLETEVPDDVLLDCIRLSQQAPTGSNMQNWRWLIVRDADTRRDHIVGHLRKFIDARDFED